MSVVERVCGCGTRLRKDNPGRLCETCQRNHSTISSAPSVPEDFWNEPRMREALDTWHIGKVITAYRRHPFHGKVLAQPLVGSWVAMDQSQISRLEAGPIVEDLSKLRMWARVLKIPQEHLWFKVDKATSPALVSSGQVSENGIDSTGSPVVELDALIRDPIWFEATRLNAERREVGVDDVEIVREMVGTFRRLDNRFGGGRARSLANNFLSSEVAPILHVGSFRSPTRESFFGAVADLNQLAGWMAYDVGDTNSGQRHLRHALRLSMDVADYARSSEMLSGLSHHAAFLRSADLAIDFADGAQQNARKSGIALLEAEAAVMTAHGFAIKGDATECRSALHRAESLFSSADWSQQPDWLKYFDEAYLAAKFAHCLREIGSFPEAETFARRSLEMSEGYERGRLFNTALLASILVDRGNFDEACLLSESALQMAARMQSNRTTKYLTEVAHKLSEHRSIPDVSDMLERYTAAGIEALH